MSTVAVEPQYHYHYVANEEKYNFSSLQSKSHIRLLVLHDLEVGDTTTSAPLTGAIIQLKLDADLNHTVLCTGGGGGGGGGADDNSAAIKSIETPSGSIAITQSLHDALTALRRMVTSPPLLWIPEISLHDEGFGSRTANVSDVHAMRHIYAQARQVVAFLGPDDDDTGEAHEMFSKLARLDVNRQINSFHDLVKQGLPPPAHPDWTALDRFMCKPWFRSIWALPAFVWAKQLQLVGERWSLNADMFIRAAINVSTLPFAVFGNGINNDELLSGATCFTVLSKLRVMYVVLNKQSTFTNLLWQFRYAEAASLSERLSILAAVCDEGVEAAAWFGRLESHDAIDTACCAQTMRFFFKSPAHGLELLSLAGGHAQDTHLPSWMPAKSSQVGHRRGLQCPDFRTFTAEDLDTTMTVEDDGTLKAFCAQVPCSCPGHNRVAVVSKINSHDTNGSSMRNLLGLWYHVQEICDHLFSESGESMTQYEGSNETLLEAAWATLHKGPQAAAPASTMSTSMTSAKAVFMALKTPDIENVLTENEESSMPAMEYLADEVEGWKFCVTHTGYIGLVPMGTEEGDVVMAVSGARAPSVFRRSQNDASSYRLVGECYLHGVMLGEVQTKLRFEERLIQ